MIGGSHGTASGPWALVVGGVSNTASGSSGSVGGGADNTAEGEFASVGGGYGNKATGGDSSISGGYGNIAATPESSISGGESNEATGEDDSWIGGGTKPIPASSCPPSSAARESKRPESSKRAEATRLSAADALTRPRGVVARASQHGPPVGRLTASFGAALGAQKEAAPNETSPCAIMISPILATGFQGISPRRGRKHEESLSIPAKRSSSAAPFQARYPGRRRRRRLRTTCVHTHALGIGRQARCLSLPTAFASLLASASTSVVVGSSSDSPVTV